jgi:hypothetical protein
MTIDEIRTFLGELAMKIDQDKWFRFITNDNKESDSTINLVDLLKYLYSDARIDLHKAIFTRLSNPNNEPKKAEEAKKYAENAENKLFNISPKFTIINKYRALARLECKLYDPNNISAFEHFQNISVTRVRDIKDIKDQSIIPDVRDQGITPDILLGRNINEYKNDPQDGFESFVIRLFFDESFYKRSAIEPSIDEKQAH